MVMVYLISIDSKSPDQLSYEAPYKVPDKIYILSGLYYNKFDRKQEKMV
jgi:hypothetical protein